MSSEAVFKHFRKQTILYCAVPLHCIPCKCGSLYECSSTLWNAYSSVPPMYPFGMLCARLLGAIHCTNGAQFGFAFHQGTVRFTLARSGPHQEVVQESIWTHQTKVVQTTATNCGSDMKATSRWHFWGFLSWDWLAVNVEWYTWSTYNYCEQNTDIDMECMHTWGPFRPSSPEDPWGPWRPIGPGGPLRPGEPGCPRWPCTNTEKIIHISLCSVLSCTCTCKCRGRNSFFFNAKFFNTDVQQTLPCSFSPIKYFIQDYIKT